MCKVMLYNRRKLEVKLTTIWTDEKQRTRSEEEVRESKKKEDARAQKGRKLVKLR